MLLFLLPLSYIVVSVREVINKKFLFSSAITSNLTIVQNSSNMDIDINNNIIRGRSALSSKINLRISLIFSSTSSISYHQHMEINNDIPDIYCQKPIDYSQMLYEGNIDIEDLVRIVTNKHSTEERQYVFNKVPTLKKASKS